MDPDNNKITLVFGSTIFIGKLSWRVFLITIPGIFLTYLSSVVFENYYTIEFLYILLYAFEILAFIAALILYFIWMFSSNGDLRRSGMDLNYSPYWSVFGYIIPLLNIWLPYSYTAELYRATRAMRENKQEEWKSISVSSIIPVWWISFVLFALGNRFVPQEIIEEYIVLSYFLITASAVCFLWSVRIILREQIEVDNLATKHNDTAENVLSVNATEPGR